MCSQMLAWWEECGERSEVAEILHSTNTTFDCSRLFNFILPWDRSWGFGDMHLSLLWPGDISPDLPSIKLYLFLFQLVFHAFLNLYDFISAVIFFFFKRWKCSIQSAKTRLRADCVSDHELLIAKFSLKVNKVGKTTRTFRYHLNQIPYDYTVEVRNRFKGLDLIDRVPDELWMEVRDIVQETGIETIAKKKKCEKAKWLSNEAL